jgi:hypothetical protein
MKGLLGQAVRANGIADCGLMRTDNEDNRRTETRTSSILALSSSEILSISNQQWRWPVSLRPMDPVIPGKILDKNPETIPFPSP